MEAFYDVAIEREDEEALIQSLEEYDEQKLRKGEFTPFGPFEMEITEGKKLYDIVGFQDTSNFAISERLYSLLSKHQITGWRGYEIRIKSVHEKYYGFQVTGRCGKLEEPKEAGFYTGYKFNHCTWDKSDFFSPDNTALLFCTKKVEEILKKNRITNIELIDINTIQNYSIGSL